MQEQRVSELRRLIEANPGADEFVELASLLSEAPETRAEAREVCFCGLTQNPQNLRGRLLLARLFYLDGYAEFCVRELLELRKQTTTPALERLIRAFGDFSSQERESAPGESDARATESEGGDVAKVVAEVDIESDFLDVLEDVTGSEKGE